MTHGSSSAISVVGLDKHYGAVRAVNGLSFEVAAGEIFALLGPNGAGKTTTLEVLEGYRRADAGEIRVLGLDPHRDGESLRTRIGVMLQDGGLYPGLRPIEVLRLFAAFYDTAVDPVELLQRVGLDPATKTTVRRLSGGQQQRLSLAAALIGQPELVFLDEPTAGMDPQARSTTWDFIRELKATGSTVVLTTHLLDEVEALCDRVAIIAQGALAAIGTPRELMSRNVANDVLFTANSPVDTAALARALGIDEHAVIYGGDGRYEIRSQGSPQLITKLATFLETCDVELGTLHANARSLEAVFLQITAESEIANEHDTADGPAAKVRRGARRGSSRASRPGPR